MDLFKKLKDWLSGGTQPAPQSQPKQATVKPQVQQQQNIASTMPKVVNVPGQQNWLKNNTAVTMPTVKVAQPTVFKDVNAERIKQLATTQPAPVKSPVVAQPIHPTKTSKPVIAPQITPQTTPKIATQPTVRPNFGVVSNSPKPVNKLDLSAAAIDPMAKIKQDAITNNKIRSQEIANKVKNNTNDFTKAPSIETRAKAIQDGINQKHDIATISNNTGLSSDEIMKYASAYTPGYNTKNPLEMGRDFVGDMANAAAGIVRKPITTVMTATGNEAKQSTNDALVALDRNYKSGVISNSKLQEETNKLVGDQIGHGIVVDENGLHQGGVAEQSKQALLGGLQQGVDTAGVLPIGNVERGAQLAGGLTVNAAKDILGVNAKQAAVYGVTSTANDIAQGRGVSAESLATNFVAPFALGSASELAGGIGKSVSTGIHKLPDTVRTNALVKAADGSQVVDLPTNKLVSYEGAPDKARVDEYKQRILNGGSIEPLYVLKGDDGILSVEDGKHRLQAYNELGITHAPTYVVTPERLRATLDPNYVGETASLNNANSASQIDATANIPSTSNHVSTKESSFDSSISESGVTKVAPRTMEERVTAVNKGIVTPETKNLPLSDRLATALNNKAAIEARNNLTNENSIKAKDYNNATDFINSQLPENASLFDPRRKELRSIWENSNADLIAAKQLERDMKHAQRELAVANKGQDSQVVANTINNLNPTGGLLVDYNPETRATAKLADNITTLDKTAGGNPDDIITIYRGAPSTQNKINPGDFVTTNYDLAKNYAGDGNVLEAKVPMSHVLDDFNEPLGDEYIYRPENAQTINSNVQIARDALEKQQSADLSRFTPEQKAMIKQELDAIIYERNPELVHPNSIEGNQLAEGYDNIPRLHVNDLNRYFGHSEDIPTRYKRTTGNEDIDLLAKSAGYDDVDQFVEAVQHELIGRSTEREAAKKLAELRRNTELVIEARKNLENGNSLSGDVVNDQWNKSKPESFNTPIKDARDEFNGNQGIANDIAAEIDRLNNENKTLNGQLKAVRNTYEFNEKTDYKTARFKQREANIVNAIRQNNDKLRNLKAEGASVASDINVSKQKTNEITQAQNEVFVKTEKAKLEAGRAEAKRAYEASTSDPKLQKMRKITELERKASEAIERGVNDGPRHTVDKITDTVAELGYLPRKRIEQMVKEYADKNGYDISTGRAFKTTTKEVGSLADENGSIKPVEDIQPSDEIMQRINRPGVKHALPYGTQSPDDMVRQMVYKHEDGMAGVYFEYKTPDGKWQKSGLDSIDIKSPQAGVKLDKLKNDAEVNKEVKRAYDTGTTAQYIWRENDSGLNSEFIREFDAAMVDGTPLDKVDSNKIVNFDPDKHYIESGKVVDSATGKMLGNYIEITPDGVNMYAGRQRISLNYNDLDLASLKKMKSSGYTWTTEGIIDRITGSLPTGIKDHIIGTKEHTNDINYFKNGGHKTKESLMHVMVEEPRAAQRRILEEDNALGAAVNAWERDFNKSVKRSKLADARRDAVYVIEPSAKKVEGEKPLTFDERLSTFEDNYGKKAAENLKKYDAFMRGVYDNLLVRMNNERVAIGKPEIKRRANYITHIAEMADSGTIGQLIQGVNNIMSGDVASGMRGSLPASISGMTEAFKPKSKYNPFSRERLADNKPLNPFDPLRVYSNLALQNIHMTKSVTMNRSLETSVRALSEAKQEMGSPRGLEYVHKLMDETIDKARNSTATADDYQTLSRKLFGLTRVFKDIEGVEGLQRVLRKAQKADGKISEDDFTILQNSAASVSEQLGKKIDDTETLNKLKTEANNMTQFVSIIQEHANKLAGKSDPLSRWVKDKLSSPATDFTMDLIRGAQKQSALSSIVGSASSALNQALSVPLTMGTTNVKYQLQALKLMHDKSLMKKSDALWLRYKESILSKKSKFQKVMDKGGIPLAVIEKNCMQWSFASKYAEALGNGLTDRQAIKYAERFIGDTTSWRDLASAPRVYDNAITSTPLQFAREVTQQNRAVWNRFTLKERVGVMLSTYVVVNALATVTGNKSGSDPLGALVESGADITGLNDAGRSDEENSPWSKAVRAGQNALSEVVTANPLLSSTANFALSKENRAKVFGKESNLGRYDGNMAMFSAGSNLVQGGYNLATGNADQAWKDLTKLAPAGGQMQKSASGLQAMLKGYTMTSAGKAKTTVDQSNPVNWAQAILFGPNALPEQKKAFDSGNTGLDEKQQKVFDTVKTSNGDTQAKDYLKAINDKKEQSIADKKAGVKSSDATVDAETKIKLVDGTWKEKDGKIVDKNDKVVTQYYKDKALNNKDNQSDETYNDFMTGYSLKKDAEVSKTGNSTLDKMKNLDNQKKASDNANTAVSLLSNSNDGYEKIPDWVKDRFYKESGFSKREVEYAASATYTVDAKVDGYFRPLAEAGDHKKLLDELYAGRVKGINNKYFATTTVIDKLYNEGYLSKAERTTLKAADLSKEGKQAESKTTSSKGSSKGSKSGKGSKKANLGYTSTDVSKYANGSGSGTYSSISAILKATRQSADNTGSKKISSPSVQARGLRVIVNSRKQSTKKRRLA